MRTGSSASDVSKKPFTSSRNAGTSCEASIAILVQIGGGFFRLAFAVASTAGTFSSRSRTAFARSLAGAYSRATMPKSVFRTDR